MRAPQTRQEAREQFKKVQAKGADEVTAQFSNNIREAQITKVDIAARLATVRMLGTQEVVPNLRYQSGATNVNIGDICLAISSDPKVRSRIRLIVY